MTSSSEHSDTFKQSTQGSSTAKKQNSPNSSLSTNNYESRQHSFSEKGDKFRRILDRCKAISTKQGVHSTIAIESAGFHYTKNEDTAYCDNCGLEISGWTLDMKPFDIHAQRSPTCAFLRSIVPNQRIIVPSPANLSSATSTLSEEGKPYKGQKTEVSHGNSRPHILVEVEMLKQIRRRTFSHWPHRTSPSNAQMIQAGFFCCNIGDRVICLYCNIICQHWAPNTDDPCEVHKTLSPKCPYVIAMLIRHQTSTSNSGDSPPWNTELNKTAHNKNYVAYKKRYDSFATWPTDNSPSVDDLVRAGFFYTGDNTTVTCFYCNGALKNWGINNNPLFEHARWFPHCEYARHLCGAEQHRKIQELKQHQKGSNSYIESNSRLEITNIGPNDGPVQPTGRDALTPPIDARLDLSICQSLLNQKFKLSVIRRCFEDQLILKLDDFATDSDLLMACILLQKQIEFINGKEENIIIPSVHMKKLREKVQGVTVSKDQTDYSLQSNLCVLCLTDKKRLACIPCGHLATCVSCGHSLRSCPICRTKIDAFVRIYI